VIEKAIFKGPFLKTWISTSTPQSLYEKSSLESAYAMQPKVRAVGRAVARHGGPGPGPKLKRCHLQPAPADETFDPFAIFS